MARKLSDVDYETDKEPGVIDQKQLKKDLDAAMKLREDAAAAAQSHGEGIKSLAENRGYHMGAFKSLLTLAKKSPEAQADFLRTFNAGIEALGLGEAAQGDMIEKTGADSGSKKAAKQKLNDALHGGAANGNSH